jgi:short-subunit dehydrogenase involved in D-alanine esterification of teichoic acids
MADALAKAQRLNLKKESRNHMATNVCFNKGATYGIGAELAKAPLVCANRVAATGYKPETATQGPGSLDNLLPVALDVTRKDQVEVAALLPTIAVVFTVGGPLVYKRRSDQLA